MVFPLLPDLNPTEHLWDVVQQEIHLLDVQSTNPQQLHDAVWSIMTKISEGISNTALKVSHEELKVVLKAKEGPAFYWQPHKVSGECIFTLSQSEYSHTTGLPPHCIIDRTVV